MLNPQVLTKDKVVLTLQSWLLCMAKNHQQIIDAARLVQNCVVPTSEWGVKCCFPLVMNTMFTALQVSSKTHTYLNLNLIV